MHIAIVGPGAIGSTFAFQLVRAGHAVTVVARGARLAQLSSDNAILHASGARAAVTVTAALDPDVAFDLVLVTVRAPQVAAVLPALIASAARRVMFMFNTFESIEPLRGAVGAQRFAFGFPGGVFTLLKAGRIAPQIRQGTTVSDRAVAEVFSAAGVPTLVEPDMQSWLRSHAALVVPLMTLGVLSFTRCRGASPSEVWRNAAAFQAGVRIVRALGHPLRPRILELLALWPRPLVAGALWLFSRTRLCRELGELGAAEPRMLIDMMSTAAPHLAGPLQSVRP